MKNTEKLLTNIPKIIELNSIGLSYKEIAEELNEKQGLCITEKAIYNCLYYVKTEALNKKYNNFTLIDVNAKVPLKFMKYSLCLHGLFIANKRTMKYFQLSHYELTNKNYKKLITTEEGMIYAKRLLRQYTVPDKELLEYLRINNPAIEKINYQEVIENLHLTLKVEVSEWITKLKKLAIELMEEEEQIK